MTKIQYDVFVGSGTEGDRCIYVRKGQNTGTLIDYHYIDKRQLELIAVELESRLNDLDPLTLFVKEVANGEMSRESMIAEAKEMMREEE